MLWVRRGRLDENLATRYELMFQLDDLMDGRRKLRGSN